MANSREPWVPTSTYMRANHAYEEADKLDACCTDHIIYRHRTEGKVVLLPAYCGSRWCPICGKIQRARAEATVENILATYNNNLLRFVTITQVARRKESLEDAMIRLQANWQKLRRSKFWLSKVRGAYVRLETIWNPVERWWHVHLHILVLTGWLPKYELSALWHRITKDSYITDVRPIDQNAKYELSKYLSKFDVGPSMPIRELVEAWRGKRSYDLYGCFRNNEAVNHLTKEGPHWERVGSISRFCADLKTSDMTQATIDICRTIRGAPPLYFSLRPDQQYLIGVFATLVV